MASLEKVCRASSAAQSECDKLLLAQSILNCSLTARLACILLCRGTCLINLKALASRPQLLVIYSLVSLYLVVW